MRCFLLTDSIFTVFSIMSALVTITTFDNMLAANLAAGHLERAGIECYIQDQNINGVYPNIGAANLIIPNGSSAYGGIKLQVADNDIARSIEVLKCNGYFNDETERPSEFTEAIDKYSGEIPFLKKFSLQIRLTAIFFLIIAIVMAIYLSKAVK